jgi:murein DD-endopeptidase MepM/ murein hydrolase activator NlpD
VKESVRSKAPGKPREPHTIIIARGDDIRHFQVRPWFAAACGSVLAAAAIGYLLATTYLVLRDDLIDATTSRQARLQQAYEDRISALRGQVDRITSRQMLDQQIMESKVGELLTRQKQLTQLHQRLDRAEASEESPKPSKSDLRAGIDLDLAHKLAFAGAASTPAWSLEAAGDTTAERSDRLFAEIGNSLQSIELQQIDRINTLAANAYEAADVIQTALVDAGIEVKGDNAAGIGGPFLPVQSAVEFDARLTELDQALDLVDRRKSEARRVPIANPSPGHAISSHYGVRADPLLGTPAMHSGTDFRAPMGSGIQAAASGKVVSAGWNGGYGRMVEIEHASGFTTRYAHMSQILVQEGQTVASGDLIGKVGSTGRSTGPHLHYEVHRNGNALNPIRFLKAGRKVGQYL